MEAVRTMGGVRFPVLTPNLKVKYVHSIGLYYYFYGIIVYCMFASSVPCYLCAPLIRDLRQLLQLGQKKSQYLHQLLKDFPSQT
jgi:hypothetical protein